jgi:NhaP-type Na+/H+ or K+/H+ antiporter
VRSAISRAGLWDAEALWAVVGFTVIVSIMLHGITVNATMRRLDRRRASLERS